MKAGTSKGIASHHFQFRSNRHLILLGKFLKLSALAPIQGRKPGTDHGQQIREYRLIHEKDIGYPIFWMLHPFFLTAWAMISIDDTAPESWAVQLVFTAA